ncbi:hypothetical protein LK09_06385 [Microbacterium mangrovi]|uniref:Uncharacterized protein n=1 Tax=Microbacterium mangrovi TaxID=1348253 RepID=A0A0B2A687_9MICO|nr:hypothetical protein [Microbacterium mangrovi]KHK98590.1 hypothetical protein LK09_06385 [Microbacterium mangrovi]
MAPDRAPRQHVEKVAGSRRARLTAAPGTTGEPRPADEDRGAEASASSDSGPNDERMKRDVPPHY